MTKRTKIIVSTALLWMAAACSEGFTSFASARAATDTATASLAIPSTEAGVD